MSKISAFLTLRDIPKESEGKPHPGVSCLELGLYQLTERSPEGPNIESMQRGILKQIEGGQLLATKTFVDERDFRKIVEELLEKYDGEEYVTALGECVAVFRGTEKERILREYFPTNREGAMKEEQNYVKKND